MNIELNQVVDDWRYLRNNTKAFINELTDEELNRKMPRPGIDTFMKHFEEMCDVEQAYLDACISGFMEFDCVKEMMSMTVLQPRRIFSLRCRFRMIELMILSVSMQRIRLCGMKMM